MNSPEPIIVYTDGSAKGNPGPGGYGIVMRQGTFEKEFSAGYRLTTNNRMELLAVIVALEKIKLKNATVEVYTDSKYVSEAVNQRWVFNWEKTSFKKKKNVDLWKRFLRIYRQHTVAFHWVKGHNNNPYNERCDKLAVTAAEQPLSQLLIDEEYENSSAKLF